MNLKSIIKIDYLAFAAVGVFLVLFFSHYIDLTTADLGRHIKNGELIVQEIKQYGWGNFFNYPILRENFYSYTEPLFAVNNHHWLGGVIFYALTSSFGFAGLHFFYILFTLAAFGLFFIVARREAGLGLSVVISILVIPLIGERTELRPEVFSYFFCAVFFYLLWSYRYKLVSDLWLWLLPLAQIFWVNSHIYFILGPALIGTFWVDALIKYKEQKKVFFVLSRILAATILVCVLNPFGFKGLLEPFLIFQNYGYQVLENQNIWFLEGLGFLKNPNFLLYKLVFLVWLVTFIWSVILARRRFIWAFLFIGAAFIAAAALALRNFALCGFFMLPVLAYQIKIIRLAYAKEKTADHLSSSQFGFLIAGLFTIVLTFLVVGSKVADLPRNFHLGLLPGINASADFFKAQNFRGPIFNDYDVGGYLIYNLFPQEKVFVDNRPEAYPASFFTDTYVPMQNDEAVWQKTDARYNFNAIFFSHRDYTPWSQKFLIARVSDPAWAPVYVDALNIIFLKRNEQNGALIKKFELPKSTFGISGGE